MDVTVVGVQPVSFTGQDGRSVTGHNIYVTFEQKNVEGLACMKVFLPARIEVVPSPGDDITVLFNRYGKVHSILDR